MLKESTAWATKKVTKYSIFVLCTYIYISREIP